MKRELVPDACGAGWLPCCLRGVLFVLRTGLPWEWMPQEVFGVSGVTCWRRLSGDRKFDPLGDSNSDPHRITVRPPASHSQPHRTAARTAPQMRGTRDAPSRC